MLNRRDMVHKEAIVTDPASGGLVGAAALQAGGPSAVADRRPIEWRFDANHAEYGCRGG